jgi:hypothetical protein
LWLSLNGVLRHLSNEDAVSRAARRTGSSVACVTARVLCSSIDLFRDYFSPRLGIPDQATEDFLHVQ